MEDWRHGGFGIYIHWPFCVSRCPYCDFNSHITQHIDQKAFLNAYLTAIDTYAAQVPGRILNSVYFGGGTPSLMEPFVVEAIIAAMQKHWSFANDIEITLEANPGSVETGRFVGYRLAGIGRISLGIQALDDTDLKKLGRSHNLREALTALEIAQSRFDRVSFDLIYARQDQTLRSWRRELGHALSLGPEHLSLYQLSIEPGTAFGRRAQAGKLRGLPSEDLAADMFEHTQIMCNNMGLPAYEVSSHARAGAESIHNMIYWQAGDYIGIGPGAHGRLSLGEERFATETPLAPTAWLQKLRANGSGEARRMALSAADRAQEYLLMGLRTRRGVALERLRRMGAVLAPDRLEGLRRLGLIETGPSRLRATASGIAVLNAILRELTFSL